MGIRNVKCRAGRRGAIACFTLFAILSSPITALCQGDPNAKPRTKASSPGADEAYVARFEQHYRRINPAASLKEYATQARFDDLYMRDKLKVALGRGIDNESGAIAWGMSYLMMAYNEVYRFAGDTRYLEANLDCVRAVLAARDDRLGRMLATGEVAPVWGASGYAERGRSAFAIQTGLIVYPILDFLTLVEKSLFVRQLLGDEFDKIANEAEASLKFHDKQWRDGPGKGEGFYAGLNQEAALEGLPLPASHLAAMGLALWSSWKLNADETNRDRALALGRYIKNRLTTTYDGTFVWPHQLPANAKSLQAREASEDIYHAGLTTAFLTMLASEGQIFDAVDMAKLGKSVTIGFARIGNGVLFGDLSGNADSDPASVRLPAMWLFLVPHIPPVAERIAPFYLNYVAEPAPLDLALLLRFQGGR